MRFVPVLPEFITVQGTRSRKAFSGPSWLYCRAEFSYHATAGVTLPPYFARRERLRGVVRGPWAANGNKG